MLTETRSSEVTASPLQDDAGIPLPSSGMASVMGKILSKRVNSCKSVILAKCKTDRELSSRKRTEKSSDRVDHETLKELETANVQRDLVVKVCLYSPF